MTSERNIPETSPGQRKPSGPLLPRRDWIYLLSLLIPLVDYNLFLKLTLISAQPGTPGILRTLGLMRSDLLFNLGYAALCIGLFAVARRGPFRWAVVILFHASAVLVALITTSAHQYFEKTGSTLDYGMIAYAFNSPGEVKGIIASAASPVLWIFVALVLLYAIFGPWLITRIVSRWRDQPADGQLSGRFGLESLIFFLLAFGLVLLSVPASSDGVSKSFSRDPIINIAVSEVEYSELKDAAGADPATLLKQAPLHTSLVKTPDTNKKNVVFIHLESTRAESVTPYNKDINTTPYLDELAKHSLMANNAYTIVPHTTKAITAVNCGVYPHLVRDITEAKPNGIPSTCLPQLLKQQGYNSVWFSSATEKFENRGPLVNNFGYDEFYPVDNMNHKGFQPSNYFGYEDDIMLKPSEDWLKKHKDKPFMATYLGVTGHDNYLPISRYGQEKFSDDPELNRYLNEIHYLDFFVKNVMDQYKKLGLYNKTIFVIYGDHGEGFGEHGLYQHDNTIYQEGLRVPMIIHEPGRFQNGKQVNTLTDDLDILPTVLDLLGYKVKGGKYPGRSMLAPPDKNRTLYFSCFYDYRCLASLKGDQKYIYFYGNQPEEVYNIKKDPLEQHNLAKDLSADELKKRRTEVLAWFSKVNATYQGLQGPH